MHYQKWAIRIWTLIDGDAFARKLSRECILLIQ